MKTALSSYSIPHLAPIRALQLALKITLLTTIIFFGGTLSLQAQTGSISGRITEDDMTTGIQADVCVDSSDGSAHFGCHATDSDGYYTVTGLDTGNYRVSAYATGYAREFYDNVSYYGDHNLATPVDVTDSQETSGINIGLGQGGTISGTVYAADGITPLEGVPVDTWPGGYGQCTDQNGLFSMEGLPLQVEIRLMAGGSQWGSCSNLSREQEFLGGVYDPYQSTTIQLEPQSDTYSTANFELGEGGTITGTIYEQDGVTAIPYANVDTNLYNGTCADGNGNYAISGLPLNTDIILSAGGQQHCGTSDLYVREFWNDQSFYHLADIINLSSTTPDTGKDFTLPQAGSISGIVYASDSTTPLANVPVDLENGGYGRCTNQDGEYVIDGLPLGQSYIIKAGGAGWDSCPGGEYIREFFDGVGDSGSATPIPLDSQNRFVTGKNFQLDQGGTITGQITEADGTTPIPNAEVCVATQSNWYGCVMTDSSGNYNFGGLQTDSYRIHARAQGFANEFYDGVPYYGDHNNATPVNVTVGQTTPNINIALDPGGVISGVVYDTQGNPLGGVPIDTDPGGFGQCTNGDGSYYIDGLPLSVDIILRVGGSQWGSCPNTDWEQLYSGDTPNQNAAMAIRLSSGTPQKTYDFYLSLGGTVSGTVIDQDTQQPLPNVTVELYFDGWGMGTCTVEDGSYEFNGISLVYDFRVAANGGEWCSGPNDYVQEYWQETPDPSQAEVFDLTGNDRLRENIDFTLQTGGKITGQITEADGTTPIPNAEVCVDADFGWFGCHPVDNDGTYEVGGLVTGTYRVYARADGFATEFYGGNSYYSAHEDSNIVNVTIGVTTPNIDIALDPGGSISGIVYDDQNAPQGDVSVDTWPGGFEVCTENDGSYTISGLPLDVPIKLLASGGSPWSECTNKQFVAEYSGGTYTSDSAVPITLTSGTPDQTEDFYLSTGGTISGQVIDQDTLQPIAGMLVEAQSDSGYGNAVCTDSNGNYSITGIPYGLELRARAGTQDGSTWWCGGPFGYAQEFWEEAAYNDATLLIASEQTTDFTDIDFTMQQGVQVTGTVTDALSQQGIANVGVVGHGINFVSTCTNGDGSYTLVIPPGENYTIVAAARNNDCGGNGDYIQEYWQNTYEYDSATPVSGTSGETVPNINFALETGGTITGTLAAAENADPLAGIWLCAFDYDATHFDLGYSWVCGQSDGSGDYTLNGVPPGDTRVWVFPNDRTRPFYDNSPGFDGATIVPVVAETITGNIDFALPEAGIITGTIYAADGVTPLQAVTVRTSDGYMECTNGEGVYNLYVPPGTHTVYAYEGPCNSEANFTTQYHNGVYEEGNALSITIAAGETIENIDFTNSLYITTSSLPEAALNAAYSTFIEIVGGEEPYTWSLADGTLPAGMTLNPNTGEISGTPTEFGSFSILVQVTDTNGVMSNQDFDLIVPWSDQQLLQNATFDSNLWYWSFYGGLIQTWDNGALEVYRTGWPVPSVFQQVDFAVPAGEVIEGAVDLRNVSAEQKSILLNLRTDNYSAQSSCAVTLAPHESIRLTLQDQTAAEWPEVVFTLRVLDLDYTPAIRVDNASLKWRTDISVSELTCSGGDPVEGDNYVPNGDFESPHRFYWNWFPANDVVAEMTAGVLRFYRKAATTNGAVYTTVNQYIPANTDLQLRFEVENTSGVAKDIDVFLRDIGWADSEACNFTIGAGESRVITMRETTTATWSQASITVKSLNADNEPWLVLDNVSLTPVTGLDMNQSCHDEANTGDAPQHLNLIANSDFDANLNSWGFYGSMTRSWVDGALEVYRTGWTIPVVFQNIPYSLPSGAVLEAQVDLSNESAMPKTVTMVLRQANYNDQMICSTLLQPGESTTLILRDVTGETWSDIRFNLRTYDRDSLASVRVDNARLMWRDDLAVTELGCSGNTPSLDTNYLLNGDLSYIGWHYWTQYQIQGALQNGELLFYRSPTDGGVMFSDVYQYFDDNTHLEMTFDMRNTSDVSNNVTVFLREGNWAQNVKCSFSLLPGEARSMTMRVTTNQTWGSSKITFRPEVYDGMISEEDPPYIVLDNVIVGAVAASGQACSSTVISNPILSPAPISAPPYISGEIADFRLAGVPDDAKITLDCDGDGHYESMGLSCPILDHTLAVQVIMPDGTQHNGNVTVDMLTPAEAVIYLKGQVALLDADGLIDNASMLNSTLDEVSAAIRANDTETAFDALYTLGQQTSDPMLSAWVNRLAYILNQ